MDRLWKWLLDANAKALFLASVILFLLVAGLVAWMRYGRTTPPAQAPKAAASAAVPLAAPADTPLAVMNYVSNQLSGESLVLPVCPFRPDIQPVRAPNGTGFGMPTNVLHRIVRVRTNRPPAAAATGPVVPVLTFRGYFQRPDGMLAALFNDSAANSSSFYTNNAVFRGVTLLESGPTGTKVRMPDGEVRALAIGEAITLKPEN